MLSACLTGAFDEGDSAAEMLMGQDDGNLLEAFGGVEFFEQFQQFGPDDVAFLDWHQGVVVGGDKAQRSALVDVKGGVLAIAPRVRAGDGRVYARIEEADEDEGEAGAE